jgi:hypothetical protein
MLVQADVIVSKGFGDNSDSHSECCVSIDFFLVLMSCILLALAHANSEPSAAQSSRS